MPKCQMCDGAKGGIASANLGYDHAAGGCRRAPPRWVACSYCGGSGEWSWSRLAAWQAGQRWEKRRRATGELMAESAARLGLKPSDISKIRNGEMPIPVDHPY